MLFFPNQKLFTKFFILTVALFIGSNSHAQESAALSIHGVKKNNATTVTLSINNKYNLLIDFYSDNIFRFFLDTNNVAPHTPKAHPPAEILVQNPRKQITTLQVNTQNNKEVVITTSKLKLIINKENCAIKALHLSTGKEAFTINQIDIFNKNKITLYLNEAADEYFFGGGVQNGRFSHKGKIIAIENQNSWTDGGVASPTPFYWSTKGYGVMWHTFKPGTYDFGATQKGSVKILHHTHYIDIFFIVNDGAVALLNDFYQLTGNPVLIPKFGFYQGHLNAYNRDYWKEATDNKGILFEDGKRYTESQKDNGGIKESLNGENNNYQFSARAVIDRYKRHDMPLGWVLPNDGYGAGYGQTNTLEGNIANLKAYGDYARKNGVEIGLWTQSDLHPKEGISALLQRDIIKEVRDAGVRALKTDVAWVGAGYSFGLNGVADVGEIMPKYGNNARPFIISLDGWAGTQRYATIWTGDQTGGQWEYIRFHIPTYLGAGLSGQPNISSDMDGIFGGQNPIVNIRDFQWKTFTPMQLNMDGWGTNEKYPHALGEPATSINRMYLKWKSMLMPYQYSIAKEAVDGQPMIRAMFLNEPNKYTLSTATKYQYLFGPYLLIAPIYQATKMDEAGNDIRNNIYLPQGTWYDYFSGEKYTGGVVTNYFNAPIWKLPVLVKSGAIIPLNNPHNNPSEVNKSVRIYEIYPTESSQFTEYDDDGTTEAYKTGVASTTLIETNKNGRQTYITIHPTKGNFNGFVKQKATIYKINASQAPNKLVAQIGERTVTLKKVSSISEFEKETNAYLYHTPTVPTFATEGTPFANTTIYKNPQIWAKVESVDITKNKIVLTLDNYAFDIPSKASQQEGVLPTVNARIWDNHKKAFSLQPSWQPIANADFYEILFDDMLYTHIKDTAFVFDELQPETHYQFKIRAINKTHRSDWQTITANTANNPLEFAIPHITATTTCLNQGADEIKNLFDFDENNMWHTKWDRSAVPFDIVINLKSVNTLDKLQYLPRQHGGNGNLMEGAIYYSNNKKDWKKAGNFKWNHTNQMKEFIFTEQPRAQYLKIEVTKALGNFGSGREMYIFKVPGSESFLPGDINNDKQIDNNDLTSYMNYTGLRKGDGDFEGYISNGDLNKNGLIDAYDISVVATQLEEGVTNADAAAVAGAITIIPNKKKYKEGEIIELQVMGKNLKDVNALSFALPYNTKEVEFIGTESKHLLEMNNFTYDRLHTNGNKALYPTFVNIGNKPTLNGTQTLFVIKLKAKRKIKPSFKLIDGILVDKNLQQISL